MRLGYFKWPHDLSAKPRSMASASRRGSAASKVVAKDSSSGARPTVKPALGCGSLVRVEGWRKNKDTRHADMHDVSRVHAYAFMRKQRCICKRVPHATMQHVHPSSYTHTHTHARTHARTHAHAHKLQWARLIEAGWTERCSRDCPLPR